MWRSTECAIPINHLSVASVSERRLYIHFGYCISEPFYIATLQIYIVGRVLRRTCHIIIYGAHYFQLVITDDNNVLQAHVTKFITLSLASTCFQLYVVYVLVKSLATLFVVKLHGLVALIFWSTGICCCFFLFSYSCFVTKRGIQLHLCAIITLVAVQLQLHSCLLSIRMVLLVSLPLICECIK